jgi:hypothetical protein
VDKLLIIFLIFMIPNIAVYAYHANHELHESKENAIKYPEISSEQFAEFIFFTAIAIGYTICTVAIVAKRSRTAPYYVILIGTVVIIIIYYMSKTIGFPVPDYHNWWMIDDSTNWKDLVTKICQQIFVIPLAMMLQRERYRNSCVLRQKY